MWRLYKSLTRGARTVRPSQCCTQDTADETGTNSSQCGPLPSSLKYSSTIRHYTSCPNAVEHSANETCRIVGVSKCLYNRIAKWGGSQVNYNDNRPKFSWVWEIPSDVLPHSQAKWKDEETRNKWEHFYKRRQQFLLTNSIFNVLGWGSAAALTWTLCQYLKTYSLAYKQNVLPSHAANFIVENTTVNSASEESSDQNSCNVLLNEEWQLSNGVHHCWATNSQNENQKTNNGLRIFNPEINKLLVTSLPTPNLEVTPVERVDKSSKCQQSLQANAQEVSDLYIDAKPQIEVDRGELLRTGTERADDSGYVEGEGRVGNYSSVKQKLCTVCNPVPKDNVVDLSSTQLLQLETGSRLNDSYNRSDLTEPDTCILLNDTCQFHLEETVVETERSERKFVKEAVTIEDCSFDDGFHNITSSPAQADEFKTRTLPPKQNASALGIDEFSDGLKEIIEAGQKDLNDFSTQCLGILEGDIGRSLACEEPGEAIKYFRAGALLGDVASTFNLALCYHMARGVEQDLKKARELYEAASLVGHGWATYNLAVMLSEGQGGLADPRRARILVAEAAKMDVKEAQEALQQMESEEDCSSNCSSNRDKVSSAMSESGRRHSLGSVQSEPLLSSLLSQVWSSSYSTTDLDFLEEDSLDQRVEDWSSLRMEATEKPRFYLE